jgi:hypothetical protein
MFNKIMWAVIAIVAIGAGIYIAVGAPKDYGKIDQGRVIAYDKEKNTVTIIRDKNEDPKKPDYTTLPPNTYALPVETGGEPRMGPEPKAGKRMKLDAKKSELIMFDVANQNFKVVKYTLIDQKENVDRKSPLLLGPDGKPKKLPAIDKEKKVITIYSGRQKLLTTLTVPDADFNTDPAYWDAGDEVRIYYREEGKALKFMNISKTDIYKK